jgi:hypothetical protein
MRRFRTLGTGLAVVAMLVLSAAPAFAAAPGNDAIDNPIVVAGHPYTNTQDTTDATTGATDADCAGMGHTVWYEYTPSAAGRLEANTFGSNYDTTLAVGTPDGSGGLDVIACNDDAGDDLQSRVRWDADAGVTYLLQVGSFANSPGGSLTFNLDDAPPFVPVELELTLDNTGRVSKSGAATISGTVTCSGADWVYMEVQLSQRVGRFVYRAYGDDVVECSDESGQWQIQLSASAGKLGPGKADVLLFAGACNEEDCEFVEIERTIQLRK